MTAVIEPRTILCPCLFIKGKFYFDREETNDHYVGGLSLYVRQYIYLFCVPNCDDVIDIPAMTNKVEDLIYEGFRFWVGQWLRLRLWVG